MELEILETELAICKLKNLENIDTDGDLYFLSKTDEEISLVCPASAAPIDAIDQSTGWRAFRICGTLDFSLVGILSKITGILAAEDIGIFVVSTFNTDYVLVKEQHLNRAIQSLSDNGYRFI